METFVLIVIVVVAGAVIGWLASLVGGTGFGLQNDVIIGIVGAFIGNYLLPQLGLFIGGGTVAETINAVIGAIVALAAAKVVKRVQG